LVVSIDNSSMSDEFLIREFIKRFAENSNREGLKETPSRVAKAWKFWCSGYDQNPADVLKEFKDGGEVYDQMLMQADIPTYSHCEHHMAAMFGVTHVAYIPNGKVVGLSKLSRVVEIYSRRLQVQERMTDQIADALWDNLQPKGVGVLMQLRHMCVESRGVQKPGTITLSSALRGCIKEEPECRNEFFSMARMAAQGLAKV
jgi:GTP cyclohydrolase I